MQRSNPVPFAAMAPGLENIGVQAVVQIATAANPLLGIVASVLTQKLTEHAASGKPMTPDAIKAITGTTVNEVAATPEGTYATGADHWYQSRSNWAALLAAAAPIAGIVGFSLTSEDTACLALLGTHAGPLIAAASTIIPAAGAAVFAIKERFANRPLFHGPAGVPAVVATK